MTSSPSPASGSDPVASGHHDRFGKFQLLRLLGAGGMAEVHLAREPLASGVAKLLVLKKIHAHFATAPEFRTMFEDEAKLAVNLNHPNIVQTFGYGHLGEVYYLTMEYVEGLDLARILNAARRRGERVPPGLAAYIVQQAAKGIDYAHRKADEYGEPLGIVHRDVSPHNILVSLDGSVKVVDFGVALTRRLDEPSGVIKGKLTYMAPEQAAGQSVDLRADIYSLGMVLLELLIGRGPLHGVPRHDLRDAVLRGVDVTALAVEHALPQALVDILERALALDPAARYQSARELHWDLGRFFVDAAARERTVYDSSTLAAFLLLILPDDQRRRILHTHIASSAADTSAAPAAVHDALAATPDPNTDRFETTSASESAGTQLIRHPVTRQRERRLVVVLAGVLSGFSTLRRLHGELRARQTLHELLHLGEHLAYKHHGRVQHLSERELIVLVGLPLGGQDDPSAAVALGVALNEALEAISREVGLRIGLRIGIEHGVVLTGGDLPYGTAPAYELLGASDLGLRLAVAALPGELLLSGSIHRAVQRHWRCERLAPPHNMSVASISCLDPGQVPEPLADPCASEGAPDPAGPCAYRVLGPRLRSEQAAPVPDRLIGRNIELATLERAVSRATAHAAPQHLLLLGGRGVGKRALVQHFASRLDPQTHLVLHATPRAQRRNVPYGLISDLVADFLGVEDDTDPREVLGRITASTHQLLAGSSPEHIARLNNALASLLGLQVHDVGEEEAERSLEFYRSLRLVVERLAEQRALVLVLTDIHLADAPALDLLDLLIRSSLARPLVTMATAQPDARLELLMRSSQVTLLHIDELGQAERLALLRDRLETPQAPATAALAARILARSGGNPLYLDEILASLVDAGVLVTTAGERLRCVREVDTIDIPARVEGILTARIGRLPEPVRSVLCGSAALGQRFTAAQLAGFELGPSDELAAALQLLVERDLLKAERSSGPLTQVSYVFPNTIVHDLAWTALSDERRAQLERDAARISLPGGIFPVLAGNVH